MFRCSCNCKCFGDCYDESFLGDDICGDCECHNEQEVPSLEEELGLQEMDRVRFTYRNDVGF